MKRKIKIFIVLVFLIVCNYHLVNRALNIAKVYPFKRILLGDKLHYSSIINDNPLLFQAKISRINNVIIDKNQIIDKLLEVGDSLITIELVLTDGSLYILETHHNFNTDIFVLFLFLIIFGNIHFLWSVIVRIIHPYNYRANLYSNYSLGIGLLFFSIVTFLMVQGYPVYLFFSVILICFLFINAGISISIIKNKEKINRIIAFFFLSLLVIISSLFWKISIRKQLLILQIIISASIITFFFLLIKRAIINGKNLIRVATVISSILLAAIAFPLTFSIIALFKNIYIPINLFSAATLIFPMIIGNNIINESSLNSFTLKRRYISKFFMDSFICLLWTYAYFYIAGLKHVHADKLYHYLIVGSGFIIFLIIRRTIFIQVQKALSQKNDKYSNVLKRIAEETVVNNTVSDKFKKIVTHIYNIVNIKYIKFFLFTEYVEEQINELNKYIKYIRLDSFLGKYYKNNKNIIKKDSFFTGVLFRQVLKKEKLNKDISAFIPLEIKNKIIGVIVVSDPLYNKTLNQNDINFLHSASLLIYHMIENEILFRHYILKRKYERSLDIASYIQLRLFPKNIPLGRGVNISFYSRPFIKVTGDYFDFVELDKNRTAFIICDVSGHGMAAAMILSIVGSLIVAMFNEKKSIKVVVEELNNFITTRYSGIELITLFISVYNKRNHELCYINAGHCLPVIIPAGTNKIKKIKERNHIIGVKEDTKYRISKEKLNPGDKILLYTDGLTELHDIAHGGDIGDKILEEVIRTNGEKNIEDIVDGFRDYIDNLGAEFIKDDITIVGIKIER